PEAGVLAHRPQPAPVHRGVDTASERVFTRIAEIGRVVDLDVRRIEEPLDLDPARRLETLTTLRAPGDHRIDGLPQPTRLVVPVHLPWRHSLRLSSRSRSRRRHALDR